MRHLKSGRKLNRDSAHRKAMFRNMASSLFANEIIKTTVPKAKELRRVAEPLITLAKEDSVAHRRQAFDRLRDREPVERGGAAPDLVEDHERALGRLVEDRRGLDHLDHERRLAGGEIVLRPDA